MVSYLEELSQKFSIHFLLSKLHRICLRYLFVLIYLTAFSRLCRLYTIEWSVKDLFGTKYFRTTDGIISPSIE